jgi:hypothetical protein
MASKLPKAALRLSSLVLTLFAGCSDPEGTVSIVTGEEADVFSRDPKPVTLVTEIVALDGTKKEVSRQPMPVDSIDLGDQKQSDIGGVAITGLGADGKPLVKGESLLVQWGALRDSTLQIFAQRTGELARVPAGPAAVDVGAVAMVEGRFVFGVFGTSAYLYDLLTLHTLTGQPTLPRAAKSVVSLSTAALLIDENGATSFDLQSGGSADFPAPSNGTFNEVAGGARVLAPDSSQLIVGGARIGNGGPSVRVFLVDQNGKSSFAALNSPREGACATYVEGRGLVVYGGGDDKAAGGEVLAPNATVATPLPYPPDKVKGCAAATLDLTHVLIAGGDNGPARVIDLACSASCTPVPWQGALPLVRAEAAQLAPDAVFILGDDAQGATHAYRASPTELREIPLKNPRRGAHLVRAPAESLLVVGGGAAGIEMYRE